MTLLIENLTLIRGDLSLFEKYSLSLPAGQYHLIGENGCGKSSLLLALSGQLDIQAGDIKIDGHSLKTQPERYKMQFGFCPDRFRFYPFVSVQHYLDIHLQAYQLTALPERAAAMIERLELTPHLSKTVGQLSLGTAKKLSIVCSLISTGQWLIWDEPLNGLDDKTRARLIDWLARQQDINLLITSHQHDELNHLKLTEIEIHHEN
jgi:ABC-2 type transport system ATP-binding protein